MLILMKIDENAFKFSSLLTSLKLFHFNVHAIINIASDERSNILQNLLK